MLKLMLLRHAKAEANGANDDFDRSLTERGKAEAARLGTYMAEVGYIPDLAFVSSARRTTQTYEIVAAKLQRDVPARFERDLYNATAPELLDVTAGADAKSLMIVGHNPGILDAAFSLARDGDLADLERLRSRFPPCTLAVLTFNSDEWQDIGSGGRLETLALPEDLETSR